MSFKLFIRLRNVLLPLPSRLRGFNRFHLLRCYWLSSLLYILLMLLLLFVFCLQLKERIDVDQ